MKHEPKTEPEQILPIVVTAPTEHMPLDPNAHHLMQHYSAPHAQQQQQQLSPQDGMMEDEKPGHKWSVMDGRPPKKALTSYMLFVKERKMQLMQENPHSGFKDMMGIVASRWRELSADDRRYFEQLAEKDRIRHDEEKAIWADHLRVNPQANTWSKKVKRVGQ